MKRQRNKQIFQGTLNQNNWKTNYLKKKKNRKKRKNQDTKIDIDINIIKDIKAIKDMKDIIIGIMINIENAGIRDLNLDKIQHLLEEKKKMAKKKRKNTIEKITKAKKEGLDQDLLIKVITDITLDHKIEEENLIKREDIKNLIRKNTPVESINLIIPVLRIVIILPHLLTHLQMTLID